MFPPTEIITCDHDRNLKAYLYRHGSDIEVAYRHNSSGQLTSHIPSPQTPAFHRLLNQVDHWIASQWGSDQLN